MENEDYPNWQKAVDLAHKWWQAADNRSANDVVAHFPPAISHLFVLCKLNFQVQNGGFTQWVDNGYCELIDETLEALEAVGTESANKVAKLVEKVLEYVDVTDRRGDYWTDDACDDEGMYYDVEEVLDKLDTAYYAMNDQFEQDVEAYATSKLDVIVEQASMVAVQTEEPPRVADRFFD